MKKLCLSALAALAALSPIKMSAQLSQNPDKFLGNITTWGNIDTDGYEFYTLWNSITGENESKWASIEGSRNNYNFGGSDRLYNYAKEHNFPFKFHCLVWGAQYPGWMDNLNSSAQYNEIIEWMDAVKARYPDLDMIDVVNEAVPGHQPAPFKDALGGDGKTGYDWIVKAFELAHERWPDAILIYNDFNTFQWNTDQFIDLVKTVRDAGAPIDAYGCQSHDLTDCNINTFKSSMTKIQNALRMPMYSSEYDIGTASDALQLQRYKEQIPVMWEADYCGGITLWGFIYGKTWVTDGNSGLIKNGVERPAMTWLREYMQTDAAKNAKSPFPNFKKEASIYVRPETLFAAVDKEFNIIIDATMATKTIDHIDVYVNNKLTQKLYEYPYIAQYTPTAKGHVEVRAAVYDTEGKRYIRYGGFTVTGERKPFHDEPFAVPGVIEAEDFDMGGEKNSFHDSDARDDGKSGYRDDNEGVDIGKTPGGEYVIGHTNTGEWLEYTIEVSGNGRLYCEAVVSSASDNSSFNIDFISEETGSVIRMAEIDVPNTGSWDTYVTTARKKGLNRIAPGKYTMRINITGSQVNIDKIIFSQIGSGITDIESVDEGTYDVYTTTGIYLGEIEVESANAFSIKLKELTGRPGVYVLRNKTTNNSHLVNI